MIELINVTKQFGKRTAVSDLSLQINEGEIFGLLGPNGAGKTTVIRMLTMLTQPTYGQITVAGKNIAEHALEIKQDFSIVPQHTNIDPDLTIEENLILHGKLHHMSSDKLKQRIKEILEYVELSNRSLDFASSLSGGMKRRLLIGRALLHEPKILYLDEPTVALDPQVRRSLWDLIRKMKNDKITILLTTHYIEEAEALCDRVAILNEGKLITLDTPLNLRQKVGEYVVENDVDGKREYNFFPTRETAAEYAAQVSGITVIRESNLEDVFIELTGRKVNE